MGAALGLGRAGGIIISGLHPVSPFRAAGFAVGDVITAVDGAPVNTPAEMVYRMSVAGTGLSVPVTRVRAGAAAEVPVALIPAPDTPPRAPIELSERSLLPGLALARVNPAVIAEMNLPLEAQGVVVTEAGRTAARIGLRRGDVLIEINGVAPESPADAAALFDGRVRRFEVIVQRADRRAVLRFRA